MKNKKLMEYTSHELAELLRRMALRLMPKGAWTQGDMAKDYMGDTMDPNDPRAVKFCLLGALSAEMHRATSAKEDNFLGRALGLPEGGNVPGWNDATSRRKKQVIDRLVNTAISLEVAEEKVGKVFEAAKESSRELQHQ